MTVTDILDFGSTLLNQHVFLIILALLLIAGLVFFGRSTIKGTWMDLKTRYHLNRLGIKEIRDFEFPDGLGSSFTVDRLIMRQDGISLLVLKKYPGRIYCAEDIDEWTQLLAGKSYRFKNPLTDLDYQVKAISSCVPDVDVNGYLFFDYQAEFPKGHPESVIGLNTIPASLKRDRKKQPTASVVRAWEKLREST